MNKAKRFTGPRVTNADGDALLGVMRADEAGLDGHVVDGALACCYVEAGAQNGVILIFHCRRLRWELPGGRMRAGETPRACAIREVREETGQTSHELRFEGLLKFRLQAADRITYGAFYRGKIDRLDAFRANDEIADMAVWDGRSEIGYIEEISRALIEGYGRS